MKIKDQEVEFDIYDAETAEAYEAATREVQVEPPKQADEGLGDYIRRQCGAVFQFFDALFGDGFHVLVFGERTNLIECLDVYQQFNQDVSAQQSRLNELTQKVQTEAMNCAQRRAAGRVVKK